ncbi:MAG: PQQ-binding-like beta-propeller repeat protein [Mariprofundales bacterium]|nr:PQQ-binding-like beta-propeller repeat protein [Mariprofundales bacterium]
MRHTLLASATAALVMLGGCAWMPWMGADPSQPAAAATPVGGQRMPHIVWSGNLDYTPLGSVPGVSQPALIQLHGSGPLAAQAALAAGSGDHYLRILSLASGSELRRVALDEAVDSGALQLANGLVVVGDIVGDLYGIDPDAGVIRWRMRLSSYLLGRPVAIGKDLLVQTMDNRIYRISAAGKKQWSFDGYAAGISMHASPSPLVTGGRVLVVLLSGDVVALDGKSGDLLWRKQLLLSARATVLSELKTPIADPLLVKDLHYGVDHIVPALLVSLYQGELHLLQAVSGEKRGVRKLSLRASPLLDGGTLFLAAADGSLRAIDIRHGETLWKRSLGSHELTGIVMLQHQLWVTDAQGVVYHISRDGQHQQQIALPGEINRAPVVTPLGVVVRTSLGGIYLIN